MNTSFVKENGTGRKTFKITEPPVDMDTKTTLIVANMTTYVEEKLGFNIWRLVVMLSHIINQIENPNLTGEQKKL